VAFAIKVALCHDVITRLRSQYTRLNPNVKCQSDALQVITRNLWLNIKKADKSYWVNRVTPRTTRQSITEDYKVIVSLLTRASLVATDGYIIG